MSDLLELTSLQAIDDDLDQVNGRLAAIAAELAENEAISALRVLGEDAASRLADVQRRQRANDGALADFDARIAREEKKLFDGSIKQFKELQALEADVAHLKHDRQALEDAGLAILAEAEAVEAEHTDLAGQLAAATSEWENASAGLRSEEATLRTRLAEAEAARRAQLEHISVGAIRLYEGLRKRKGGKAVVRIQGSSCAGCRVAVPDPVRRRILNAPVIVQCPHCERILALG